MAKILTEFKQFAVRGNLVDMTIGITVGAAFGRIATSLVNDVLMPPIGLLLSEVDFANLYINLTKTSYASLADAKAAGAATINYGTFLNTVISFLLVALVVFLLVRQVNRMKRRDEAPPPAAPTAKECPYCLSQVPLKATRCAYCTSTLEAVVAADAQASATA